MNYEDAEIVYGHHRAPLNDGHSTSINCLWGMGGKGRGSSLTNIYLDYVIFEFPSRTKKKKKNSYMDHYGRRLKQII